MKVLLVDDNLIILQRFVQIIDWHTAGFEQVLTAPDGKQALDLFIREKPELVITDIYMPRMDGLELAKCILAQQPDTVIYFLSSYDEFTYAKSALEIGISGYMLKHEATPEVLTNIVEQLKRERKRKRHQCYCTSAECLRMLVQETEENALDDAFFASFKTDLSGTYDLFYLEHNHILPVFNRYTGCETKRLRESVLRTVCSACLQELEALVRVDTYGYLALIRSSDSDTGVRHAYALKKALNDTLDCTFSVFILAEHAPIDVCAQSYVHSKPFFPDAVFYGRSSITHVAYMQHITDDKADWPRSEICQAIEAKNYVQTIELMEKHYRMAIENRNAALFNHLTEFFVSILFSQSEKIINYKKGIVFKPYVQEDVSLWYDAASVVFWLKRQITEMMLQSDEKDENYSRIVCSAMDYIQKNYADSLLSVEQIAAALKISSSRLSVIFKRESGETVRQYIINVRMDHAKELLRDENNRVTDICQQTGYTNTSYFSKTFREKFHMTPLEYRRTNHET